MKKTYRQQGFTLVEMSLVLVVIGLILGALSVGKDMQRNAEYKKIKQKFVDQWVQAYNQYYDRMGVVVGDRPKTPTLAVNAVNVPDGSALNVLLGTAGANDKLAQGDITELCSNTEKVGEKTDLLGYFHRAGIGLPTGRANGYEDRYVYLDTNGNPQQLTVCFRFLVAGADHGAGNVMVIKGLTPDLARSLDSAIDGLVDADDGRFRLDNAITLGLSAGDGWPTGNNTVTTAGTGGSSSSPSEVKDYQQVTTLTAFYRMTQ
ncbi:type II secretion system protein [Pseudoalteromonas peptidolytica]|uniref:type II secretion system protein n=1 Tax=Pseudoalteromonas peptidolytica TaxID=61150 RepID=UPI00298EAE69|nr:type II secretion system protein [Pseudoalteromonas peptidolytica]MDW7549595.1 type II secretion system protein [Pseudoalteromonas peptidolytica]